MFPVWRLVPLFGFACPRDLTTQMTLFSSKLLITVYEEELPRGWEVPIIMREFFWR